MVLLPKEPLNTQYEEFDRFELIIYLNMGVQL
jgi:hypothetical protein